MGKNYPIAWTDHIFNPWIGCTCVSPGCDRCCAEAESRARGWAEWGEGQPRQKTSKTAWALPAKWNTDAMTARRRRRVLCSEMADVFDDEVEPGWREELWALIRQTPYLDWILLTKRPGNIAAMLPPGWGEGWANVCLMVSVENQEQTARIPALLAVPAKYKAVAFEPLLSPVKLQRKWLKEIDWIVVGGEQGEGSRPTNSDWVRALQKQCESAKIRFYFKQWGNWVPDPKFAKIDGSNVVYFPNGSTEPRRFDSMEGEEVEREMKSSNPGKFMYRTDKHISQKLGGFIYHAHPFRRSIPERDIILPLTAEERHRLKICEKTIRDGMGTFVAVGNALLEIRSAKLYRQEYPTFEAYVQSVLALTRPRAYQLIDSAEIMRDLSATVDVSELPQNEAQVRELCRWKTPEERVEKWKAILAVASEQPVTAKFIRQTLLPAPKKKSSSDREAKSEAAATCIAKLRRLVSDTPAEARISKLIAKLEEALVEADADAAPASVPTAQPDLWLPGFL